MSKELFEGSLHFNQETKNKIGKIFTDYQCKAHEIEHTRIINCNAVKCDYYKNGTCKEAYL